MIVPANKGNYGAMSYLASIMKKHNFISIFLIAHKSRLFADKQPGINRRCHMCVKVFRITRNPIVFSTTCVGVQEKKPQTPRYLHFWESVLPTENRASSTESVSMPWSHHATYRLIARIKSLIS